MELKQLFQKPLIVPHAFHGILPSEQVASTVQYLHDVEVSDVNFNLVVIGIADGFNSPSNNGCAQSPDEIRKYFYGMRKHNAPMRILDLGNVLGSTVKDRYWAVKETVSSIANINVPILVLGGSQDYSIPIFNGLRVVTTSPSICIVDSSIDCLVGDEDLSSSNFLGNLLAENNGAVGQISFLGLQKYLLGEQSSSILDQINTENIRLGDLRGDLIKEAEPLLRVSNLVSFDSSVMKFSDMPGQDIVMPNGLLSHEICQLSWYAGMSDVNQVFGVFEVNGEKDQSGVSVALAAQMAWFYIEGITCRCGDYPIKDLSFYSVYNLDKEEYGIPIRFFHNPTNGRWWVGLGNDGDMLIKACSEKDYQLAVENEIPDKWWKHVVPKP